MKKSTLTLFGSLSLLTLAPQTLAQTPLTEARHLFNNPIAQQTDPNQDRFIQPSDQLPQPLGDDDILMTPETFDTSDLDNTTPITINNIILEGNTVFTREDLMPMVSEITGPTTIGAINRAIAAITAQYVNAGYITSRAVLPAQPLDQGEITILVLEGTLTDVDITGLERLNPEYVRSRVNLGRTTPFNANALEDQLRLLNNDPNIADLNIDLQSSEELGTSRLALDIEESKPWFGSIFTDNYSAESVGSERIGANVGYRNLAGMGDALRLGYTRTYSGGYHAWDFGYNIPLNPMNGTLDLRVVLDRHKITLPPFDALNIRGRSQLYDLSFRQPLIRNPREEFALSLGFSRKTGRTFLFNDIGTPFGIGAEADGTTRTSVIRFSQDYLRRDTKGAWSGRSQFNLGIDALGITRNDGPIPDGHFFSWAGQVARVQQLDRNNRLILQGDFQLTPDNLLASETFSIGGGQTLRGYRQGARSGDNGWRFSAENRFTVARSNVGKNLFQIAPFFDMGAVWNNPSNPAQIRSDHLLAGLGLGFLWISQPNFTARVDVTLPLMNMSDRATNLQDDGIYLSLNYQF
ncbi:ShlB/FhaC/HecB family hemolysin secretion/activation protein [Spirulina major CS-329]|uniref:ShlB/FhaC/HecB family hemolysin secretion/activation protein n=1 Tax=Spirulina TaxID=1154 RepID=UPI00232D45B2|nr:MULTISPECIES: ShlB/FhaC/HecB family hemolysin secretion/activation protein [Spirulina]MDB9493350.1 ShlB/FhaC/HecB family hemolysin secretion/activation protein [Spirulina subsalsa CS-330]MDB9502519.1 ShlB/FhaC/HecB family hemolysin secretion/activation protein [Spirulina major CS-329]